jgi:hypothetical protein
MSATSVVSLMFAGIVRKERLPVEIRGVELRHGEYLQTFGGEHLTERLRA